ncbi:hypothetical protein CRUP_033109 [Coryphaenoides rupestris]|nr:hypothetical protein CRUP_033109 [Coryphaenoides rupestris]
MSTAEDEETTVSLVDVLQEDEELENEASAVLAGSDSDLCSYPQGYVKRQALYACNTCTPKGGEAAGVCLACSYKCHEGHDLFELYTKRNFRCDCGNSKFNQQCKLHPDKEQLNSQNKYSHNFFGLYCTCNRPYPDPDDQVEDEMVQCILCEDWLHGREMVCEACMNKNPFLWTYVATLAAPDAPGNRLEGEEEEEKKEEKKEEEKKNKEVKSEETSKKEGEEASTSLRCYLASGVGFLLDQNDTVLAYETRGQRREEHREVTTP